jgi:pyruvate,water dikinase
LVEEGRLLDADAVYFLTHEELGRLAIEDAGSPLASEALRRRDVLAYQETLSFPEVAVGLPQPEPPRVSRDGGQTIVGKPVSRGRVEGRVRVVHTLEEAEALEPGEILVAPITDVGWTPYFAIIAGLVTDVGSAVSHGAVVAREYGLPAVLNTREGTRMLRTGERVVLDGDRGIVERLED